MAYKHQFRKSYYSHPTNNKNAEQFYIWTKRKIGYQLHFSLFILSALTHFESIVFMIARMCAFKGSRRYIFRQIIFTHRIHRVPHLYTKCRQQCVLLYRNIVALYTYTAWTLFNVIIIVLCGKLCVVYIAELETVWGSIPCSFLKMIF